ncbi:MAG: hypothetical protein PWP24_1499, partial [Clostridiales bacterium]|nr:hypothetical protein [Clostridiales bacterium]
MQYLLTQQYPFYSWYHILIDFTGLALNSFFLLYLLKQSFGIKASLRRQKTYFYLAAAVTTLGFIATGEISHHKGYIYYTTFLFFGILFSALLFEGSFSIKFISVILYTSSVIAINGFVETLLYAICNLSDYSKLSVSLFTLLFIIKRIGEYVFVYFLVRFLIYLSPKRFFSIPKIYWLSYLILLLIGIIQAYTSIFGSLKNITSLLNFSIILGTNLCIYYFFNTSIAQ